MLGAAESDFHGCEVIDVDAERSGVELVEALSAREICREDAALRVGRLRS